LLKLVFVSFS